MKDILGYEGRYAVSESGRIWSYPKKGHTGKWLKSSINNRGYTRVVLVDLPIQKMFSIHQLVARTFIPNPSKKIGINHKNGIKTDNRVDNLEWATDKENTQHAINTGLMKLRIGKGEKSLWHKLTDKEVLEIRALAEKTDITQTEIGKMYGTTQTNVSKIKRRANWSHL